MVGIGVGRVSAIAVIAASICVAAVACAASGKLESLPGAIGGETIQYEVADLNSAAEADPAGWQAGVSARVDIDDRSMFFAIGTANNFGYSSVVIWAVGHPGLTLAPAFIEAFGRSPDISTRTMSNRKVIIQRTVDGNVLYYLVYQDSVLVFDISDDSLAEAVVSGLA